ncbi:hypothetical protein [Halolamina sp. C58]|uniref:hypothetical protein n=1 Tax=Halolamina sp. C58 TaxID=3421640 RepID=UPI003EBB7D64
MVPGIVPDVLLFLLALWVFDSAALLPILISSAVRRLFADWPTDYLIPNYLAGTTAFAIVHLVAIFVPVALHGGSLERNVVGWLAGMTLVNLVLWWLVVGVALPLLGRWRPKADGEYDGRIALTFGVITYGVATVVIGFVIVVIVIAVGFPG